MQIVKVTKIIIAIVILVPVVGIFGIYSYIKIENNVFYGYPTYLPSAFKENPILIAGPGDLDPIIDQKWYQYICGDSVGLSIYQARKGVYDSYNPNSQDINDDVGMHFSDPVSGIRYYPEDFILIESRNIKNRNNYSFKKYSIDGIKYQVYELFWQTKRLDLKIQSDSKCMPQDSADLELIKIAESLK